MPYLEFYLLKFRQFVHSIMIMMKYILFLDKSNGKKVESSKNLNIKQNNNPLIILGPSAVGKDTMINRLKAKYPENFYKLPSYTTRQKRNGEIDGIDYFFITREEFIKMKKEGNLFAIQEYNNNYYASNKTLLREVMKNKTKIVILNYNIETTNIIKDELEFNFVAILPPNEETLRDRLFKRKTKLEEINKRMEKSKKEIKLIKKANYINYRLINDEEEKSYNELENYLKEIYPHIFL